jgi:hypothetical protein
VRTRRVVTALVATSLSRLVFACADHAPPDERFALVLRAFASDSAVEGVRVWADGRQLGTTSRLGRLSAELRGQQGSAVELTLACPPAYRTEQPTRRLVLRRVEASAASSPRPLELDVHCEPLQRAAAIVVLASGRGVGGLPIRVRGEVVGQTETDGSAHLLLSTAPHAPIRIELDTSNRPNLRPKNPVHTFRLTDEDRVLLIEQDFTTSARARPAHRPPPPLPPPPVRPIRKPQRID